MRPAAQGRRAGQGRRWLTPRRPSAGPQCVLWGGGPTASPAVPIVVGVAAPVAGALAC
jgi:hypothetical protein